MEKHFLYLHLGMPKTGTSAIQEFLSGNGELLERNGLAYTTQLEELSDFETFTAGRSLAQDGDCVNGRIIEKVFIEDFCRKSKKDGQAYCTIGKDEEELLLASGGEVESDAYEPFITGLKNLLKEKNVIISNECLWAFPKYFLRKMAESLGDAIKVIVYLRRPDRFMESMWNEFVMVNLINIPFDSFADAAPLIPEFRRLFDIRGTLDDISDIVGSPGMILRVYGKNSADGERFDSVREFMDILGIEERVERKSRKNSHISGNMVEYIRTFNSTINRLPGERSVSKEFREHLIDMGRNIMKSSGVDYYFSPGHRRSFLERCREDICYIEQTYLKGERLLSETVPEDAAPTIRALSGRETEIIQFTTLLAVEAFSSSGTSIRMS